ncbi:hypothetical protein BGX30_000657, partial [Mortierella sp. GBA39]
PKETDRMILPAFDSINLISRGEHAQTYKESWGGHNVVMKKCDIRNQGPVVEELKMRRGHIKCCEHFRCVPRFAVYIRGSPGQPSHPKWVKKFLDVRHISFEVVSEDLLKNIVTSGSSK